VDVIKIHSPGHRCRRLTQVLDNSTYSSHRDSLNQRMAEIMASRMKGFLHLSSRVFNASLKHTNAFSQQQLRVISSLDQTKVFLHKMNK